MKLPWQKDEGDGRDAIAESQEQYWARDVEVPTADIDRMSRNQTKLRQRRWFVWGCMTCGILALASSCNTQNRVSDLNDKMASSQIASAGQDSAGRFAATQSVEQWLASSPAPLPGGKLVNWTGATQLGASKTDDANDDTKVSREIDTFTLTDGVGHGYSASVLVAYTDEGQVSVLSGPSIVPRVVSSNSDFAGGEFWPGLEATAVSDTGKTAIETWASAFTSGDGNALRQAVGDPDAKHIYVPITGVQSTSINVDASAKVKDGLIAQVTVTSKWTGRNYANNTDPKPAVYDVLITGADTAAPRVVAWGAPGSGPTLKAYSNAVVLKKAQIDDGGAIGGDGTDSTDAATASPSSSPTTGEGTAPSAAPTKNTVAPSASSTSSTSGSTSSASKPSQGSASSPAKK